MNEQSGIIVSAILGLVALSAFVVYVLRNRLTRLNFRISKLLDFGATARGGTGGLGRPEEIPRGAQDSAVGANYSPAILHRDEIGVEEMNVRRAVWILTTHFVEHDHWYDIVKRNLLSGKTYVYFVPERGEIVDEFAHFRRLLEEDDEVSSEALNRVSCFEVPRISIPVDTLILDPYDNTRIKGYLMPFTPEGNKGVYVSLTRAHVARIVRTLTEFMNGEADEEVIVEDRGGLGGPTDPYHDYAQPYSDMGISGTYLLAFRDVACFVQRHAGGRALDFGCGAGRSSRFLKLQGLNYVGVDCSEAMIEEARRKDPDGVYQVIPRSDLSGFPDRAFDLVFSTFVLNEISTKEEMGGLSRGFRRVLRPGGTAIVIVSSPDVSCMDCVSICKDFPENHGLGSGDRVRVVIPGAGTDIVLYDYYWTREDFRAVFAGAGLQVERLLEPLGTDADGVDWACETTVPPFLIYVLRCR